MRDVRFAWLGIFLFAVALAPRALADEVLDRLGGLPGVEAKETTTAADTAQGLRRFVLTIEQPTDHFAPELGSFKQKLVLFHRSFTEPMVLQTSGYVIFGERLSRIAATFATNQIQVEHRFFGESAPSPKDWTKLTVRQSAEDFHRIVETFKRLYTGRWVNTGASKGGMTSVYHRRFYPNDLDGTVADVAPLSFSTSDERYVGFVNQVGGERYSACRAKLEAFQIMLLRRRAEILPLVEGEFTALGGKDVAFEHTIIELPFVFWQYGNPEDANTGCARIPGAEADTNTLWAFYKEVNDPASYADPQHAIFMPYFYQTGNELGAPAAKMDHLQSLLQHPYTLEQYFPAGEHPVYSNQTMHDMRAWVANEARTVMFVYGEFDPWTAGAFRDVNGAEGTDNHWYLLPSGNHGANFLGLPQELRAQAIATLSRWLSKAPSAKRFRPGVREEFLEDVELRMLRKLRRLH